MLIGAVDRYLEIRRSAGYQLKCEGRLLQGYARFATKRGDSCVQRQSAIDWAADGSSNSQRERRLSVVRRFARHLHSEGPGQELIPEKVFSRTRRRRPIPYLFSSAEIQALLEATASLQPRASLRPLTYYTLFGVLSSTGMRISEVINLRVEDITSDGLIVRNTKFRKSRLVPLHETTTAALDRYLGRRQSVANDDRHVFVSRAGRGLTYCQISGTFHRLLKYIDLRLVSGQRAPRLHDFRHTLAVRSLEQCSGTSDAVSRHILALSTYLGHAHVTDTYWYLQLTPGLVTEIADACESLQIGGAQ